MEHGGDVYTQGLLKGKTLIDFSSNINPLGVPTGFKEHINEAIEALIRYPDIEYRELKENLKEYMEFSLRFFDRSDIKSDWENENIVLGNGASEIIDLVISEFKEVLLISPCFIDYENCAKKWGCNISYSYLDSNMEYNYKEILAMAQKCEALVIGNPNNPNGCTIDKIQFKKILDYCEQHNKKIIVDEAFIEFTGRNNVSLVAEALSYKCLFIVRAVTKFYAMPGIRLGWGVSKDALLILNITKKQNPWNVNSFAEMAAKYVLKDIDYIERSLKWLACEKNYLKTRLKEISFIDTVYESSSNYLLLKLKGKNCHQLHKQCLAKDILVRKADNYKGLDDSYVRIAVKDRELNDQIIKAFLEVSLE